MRLVIVAPNVSENMSGEAIKVFMYLKYLATTDLPVELITHERSRDGVAPLPGNIKVHVLEDGWSEKLAWRSVVLRPTVHPQFFVKARELIKKIAAEDQDAFFQYMVPVSPLQMRFPVASSNSVLGPVTGNIFYPEEMRDLEPSSYRKMRQSREFLNIAANTVKEKHRFKRILNSGGERTRQSLLAGGASDAQISNVWDSGVSGRILEREPIPIEGECFKFICNGRFDAHKGVDLAIRAVAAADARVTLDIYGRGYMASAWEALVAELGLQDRVQFKGWVPSHDDLLDAMANYRGFVFPSLAEANGIVVQEALALGLPIVCLNHGGPSALTTNQSAIRIEPGPHEQVVTAFAEAMNRLATDPELARSIAGQGIEDARREFSWANVTRQWLEGMKAEKLIAALG